jgi:hypothetical protein
MVGCPSLSSTTIQRTRRSSRDPPCDQGASASRSWPQSARVLRCFSPRVESTDPELPSSGAHPSLIMTRALAPNCSEACPFHPCLLDSRRQARRVTCASRAPHRSSKPRSNGFLVAHRRAKAPRLTSTDTPTEPLNPARYWHCVPQVCCRVRPLGRSGSCPELTFPSSREVGPTRRA